jgi:hypothetical protein
LEEAFEGIVVVFVEDKLFVSVHDLMSFWGLGFEYDEGLTAGDSIGEEKFAWTVKKRSYLDWEFFVLYFHLHFMPKLQYR